MAIRDVISLLDSASALGVGLAISDGRLRITAPSDPGQEILEAIRKHKDELLEYLSKRSQPGDSSRPEDSGNAPRSAEITGKPAPPECPPLPRGVHLVSYEPKTPPVAVDVCVVATDVGRFIRSNLDELEARLHHPLQVRGGFSIPEILARLAAVGVELKVRVSVEKGMAGRT